ncbi:MAG: GNAT family N-acetyltransferase [Mesorhizobium sp.]|uniref:GNAT family N-acetyltransferase n=1 Tax=Mesorhizobium sp. TaxID=1871066 RepID=UPI000FD1CE4C|nr:GNAT family N-acetyltransferase [Mesorhizobium sp.]RVD51992.1 GNAT family N-acetyltransferase [Mesorhizobium sp. M8A.F.Ca.ET.023.02.2.1]RWC78861.1 MAG: GNAT family N-acetyltransferase [Mesorhizobium sp.]RWF47409.1 MAG: GNAT family N-acetyltransferase [Mesorhizobium sp.]
MSAAGGKTADGLEIKAVEPADLPALALLYQHLNPGDAIVPPEEAQIILERFVRYPGSVVLGGWHDDELVASCTLVVIPNLTRGGMSYALIENVVTAASHRKRGFGRALLERAVSIAWEHGCYKAMLLTGSTEPATLAFYRGAGFEQNKTGFQIRRLPIGP